MVDLADVRARPAGERRLLALRGLGPSQEEALPQSNVELDQRGALVLCLDALGNELATSFGPSKDDVIVAWLQDPRTRWFESVRAKAEAGATMPDDVIPRLFGALADWLEAGDYRGCPYLNTAIELGDPDHQAMPVVRSYLDEIQQYLAEIVEAAGYREPALVAAQLQIMVAGAITLGVAVRSGGPAIAASEAASRMLAETPRA